MVVLRRHKGGITLNPYEYVTDDDNNIINFKDQQEAVKYCQQKGLEIDNGEQLWNIYGIECHEIDRAQFAQVSEEIKNNEDS